MADVAFIHMGHRQVGTCFAPSFLSRHANGIRSCCLHILLPSCTGKLHKAWRQDDSLDMADEPLGYNDCQSLRHECNYPACPQCYNPKT